MGAMKVNGSTENKSQEDIKRHRFSYCFNGVDICVAADDINEDMLKAIVKHAVNKGITQRIHGNTEKGPKSLCL